MSTPTPPPKWTVQELRGARDRAESAFKVRRRDEGPIAFAETCAQLEPKVRAGLVASQDLRLLTGDVFRADPTSWQMFRYVCAPPVSQEDLWTLVGGPKFTRTVPPDYADDTAEAFLGVIDPVRFPWVSAGRAPTTFEREAAVLATTTLWAAQLLGTQRRGDASRRQEDAVAAALESAGMSLDPARTRLQYPDGMDRGTYSRERKIGDAKCDVPARLVDGRLLAIECKVSNGPKNGWKRVNREVVGKADYWRASFGVQVVTAVVLAGVFDLSCVQGAQTSGVTVLWEDELEALGDFVASVGG